MVDCHPSESIVNLGCASVYNVSSGWQYTMSPYKECDIYILLIRKGSRLHAYLHDKRDDFNVIIIITTFLFLGSNILPSFAYGVFISQFNNLSRSAPIVIFVKVTQHSN